MKRSKISDSIDHITDSAVRSTGIAVVRAPAVLIVVRGMILARFVPCALTQATVTLNQDMKALLPKPGMTAEYLAVLLTGFQRELMKCIDESGHGTRCLRTDSLCNVIIPVPPPSEQAGIYRSIQGRTADVDTQLSRIQKKIELIREYRTRLTDDVVTGRLDVRAAADRLSVEIEAPEAEPESGTDEEAEDLLEEVSADD